MNIRILLIVGFVVSTLNSFAQREITVTEYIDMYKYIAMNEMETSGIPASITLAQGILESGSGKGRLSVEANNHFGIYLPLIKGKIFKVSW